MKLNLGLTTAQIAERKKGIGGSDAYVIAAGTDEERYQLWAEKTGRAEPKAILAPWDAALRHHCEGLILDWYEQANNRQITQRAKLVVSEDHPMLRCNLDGMDESVPKVIDAKMLNAFVPDALEWARTKYSWQIVHQMICCRMADGSLYVSVGMREPVELPIEYDEFEAASYIDRARAFWAYVKADKEPPGAPPPLQAPIPIETMRKVDMTGNNEWASSAADWRENKDAAKKFDDSVKALKKLVEADVREASGHGVVVKRDKRGLAIKEAS